MLYKAGANSAKARADIAKAGGSVVMENAKVGYALVRSSQASFATAVAKSASVEGAARNRVIGTSPKTVRSRADVERLSAERAGKRSPGKDVNPVRAAATAIAAEPLADRQWDMRQIGATPGGSYAKNQGSHAVLVGIVDTGIDGTHPDIAPNFNACPEPQLRYGQPVHRRAV